MSKIITIARQYAKATFSFAIEHQAIEHWQKMLIFSVEVRRNQQISELLSSTVVHTEIAEIFIEVCGSQLNLAGQNLIRILAETKRLKILPDILQQFIFLRREYENTLEVNVISAKKLQKKQLEKISTSMEQRLLRKIKLNNTINELIIAGIMIHVGDMVIDGSISGRLKCLSNVLQY